MGLTGAQDLCPLMWCQSTPAMSSMGGYPVTAEQDVVSSLWHWNRVCLVKVDQNLNYMNRP